MNVPPEYHGREQSWLKHLFLKRYLEQWAHKLGSTARSRTATRLWYVDAFAGPWHDRHPELQDTSFAIGLSALSDAASTWRARGFRIDLGAIFVEPDDRAFARLEAYVQKCSDAIDVFPYHGAFGDYVGRIREQLRHVATGLTEIHFRRDHR